MRGFPANDFVDDVCLSPKAMIILMQSISDLCVCFIFGHLHVLCFAYLLAISYLTCFKHFHMASWLTSQNPRLEVPHPSTLEDLLWQGGHLRNTTSFESWPKTSSRLNLKELRLLGVCGVCGVCGDASTVGAQPQSEH